MTTYDQLAHELQDALFHLYDPDYQPSQMLCALVGCDIQEGVHAVQSAIIRMIQHLEPPPDTPPGARTRQIHALLHSRFVLKLTQEETAERLAMSVSTAKRAQRRAIQALARLLWDRRREGAAFPEDGADSEGTGPPAPARPGLQARDWRSQTDRELASLQARAPGVISDVGEVIDDVLNLRDALPVKESAPVRLGHVQSRLTAAVHPAILRQMLLTALGQLTRTAPAGAITIYAGLANGDVRITLTGDRAPGTSGPDSRQLVRDVLVPQGASVRAGPDGDRFSVWLELPSVGRTAVLVVDDNPDMAHFFQRAAGGTRYRVVPVARGRDVFDAIEATGPAVIVLDVMLPDVDGWRLLMHLHENPATRSIPVIVCSVVREEQLALTLGAAAYLSKPVRPRRFVETLDKVLGESPTDGGSAAHAA